MQRQPEQEEEEEDDLQPKLEAGHNVTGLQRQPLEEDEEEKVVQGKGNKNSGKQAGVSSELSQNIHAIQGSGKPLSRSERAFFEPRFGCDLSRVRIHDSNMASKTASAINAQAFTYGNDIVFGPGHHRSDSESGKHLLAHELTHVVQQGVSNRRGVIQRRRIPAQADLSKLVISGNYDLPAHRAGLARLILLALAEMGDKQKKAVHRAAWKASGKSLRVYYRMPKWQRNLLIAQAIYQSNKEFRLGDPVGTEKPATPRANVKKLHDRARACMSKIFNGNTYDNSIRQVFGNNVRYVRDVKKRFRNAHAALGQIYLNNKILTDRSGYMKEVGLGAEANPSEMNLSPNMIDNPTATKSIIKTIHESLHAGNYVTMKGDSGGYNDGSKRFREVPEAIKLKNPDHYTVIAWRILAHTDKHAHLPDSHKKFKPKSRTITRRTSTRGATRIALIEGSKQAKQILTSAVSNAISLHDLFRNAYSTPSSWNQRISHPGVPRNARFSNTLPYWSKVENLTIHKRLNINQYTSDPSGKPVSTTDLAISEGVVRRLNLTRNYIWDDPAKTRSFLNRYASSRVWRRARKSISLTRNLIIKRILRNKVKNITGNSARDFAAVKHLADAKKKGYSGILKPRKPRLFPYP